MIFPLLSFGESLSNLESPGNKAPPWGGEKGKKRLALAGVGVRKHFITDKLMLFSHRPV